ncbi:MAG TPA: hypothetical protein VMT73_12485 [Anaerolineales bacterium]|nr:hypothetical protein [Anaerolineales bacterium]
MQSFTRGWSFLQEAWSMAFKDKDLIKPSIYALIVGMIVSVLGVIPIIAVAFLTSDSAAGNVLMFICGAILVFVQFVVSYVFSAMTVYLIYGYLAEGDGRMDKAWAKVQKDFFNILTLAAASTAVNLLRSLAQRNRRGGIGASIARAATGLLQVLWTEASYLVLPAMVIDDLNLKDGLARVLKITKENLLLIGISTVGVGWVTGLISFILGAIGAVIGFAVGYGVYFLFGSGTAAIIIGIAIGAIIFFAFVMVASVIHTYTTVAYHTCLYLWARETEKVRATGQAVPAAIPAPLAAVLGNAA